jgi:hypothetical protein
MKIKTFCRRYKIVRKLQNKNPEVRNKAFIKLALDTGQDEMAKDLLSMNQFDKDLLNQCCTQDLIEKIH